MMGRAGPGRNRPGAIPSADTLLGRHRDFLQNTMIVPTLLAAELTAPIRVGMP